MKLSFVKRERKEKNKEGNVEWKRTESWEVIMGGTDFNSSSCRDLRWKCLLLWVVIIITLKTWRKLLGTIIYVVKKTCVYNILILTFPWNKVWVIKIINRLGKEICSMGSELQHPKKYALAMLPAFSLTVPYLFVSLCCNMQECQVISLSSPLSSPSSNECNKYPRHTK